MVKFVISVKLQEQSWAHSPYTCPVWLHNYEDLSSLWDFAILEEMIHFMCLAPKLICGICGR